MLATLRAFFESLAKTMQAYEAKVKNQTTTEVVRDKKALKRASNITEEILDITGKYVDCFTKADAKKYDRLRRKFMRYN